MRIPLISLLVFLAAPAAADICEDWWFTKNLIYDRAGHCFTSALGRAQFDNGDCIGANPQLPPEQAELVAEADRLFAEAGCEIDTADPNAINHREYALRRQMADLPLRIIYESGCSGWRGPMVPLRVARSSAAEETGTLRPGDDFAWLWQDVGPWAYIEPAPDRGGWVRLPFNYGEMCDFFAG